MNILALESFIVFCDKMMISTEGRILSNEIEPRLSRRPDLLKDYDSYYTIFFNNISSIPIGKERITRDILDDSGNLLITKHAFDMHSQMTLSNLCRKEKYGSQNEEPIVSYYPSNIMLKSVVRVLLKNHKNQVINFLFSRKLSCEIDGILTDFIGYGFYKDEKYKFKCARVVLGKDFDTGEIFVKTTYPIPYIGYNKRDLEKEGVLDVPTVMKLE